METNEMKKRVLSIIQNENIHTVRVSVMDLSGVSRSRNVPVDTFVQAVMESGIDCPSALFYMDSSGKIVEEEKGFEGGFPSWVLVPDLSTFITLPWSPRVAKVIADVYDGEGKPVPFAPRTILKRIVKSLEEKGLFLRGAFEFEFYVFKKTDGKLTPISESFNSYSEVNQVKVNDILDTITSGLQAMGSAPEVGNTEYGTGQFEITYRPFIGVGIADMAIYYKSAIKEILLKQELIGTFMSKPLSTSSSSGGHLHLSIIDEKGNNLFLNKKSTFGLSTLCKDFISSQIHHAAELNALCNSTINSYKRIRNHYFAPMNATWSLDNRTAMIRVPRFRDENTRIEHRLPGADTNPYIALSAIAAAGLDGIDHKHTLPTIINGNAYEAEGELLEVDLLQSIKCLNENSFFTEIFGKDFIEQYKKLRYSEYERYQQQITQWELDEYVDLF